MQKPFHFSFINLGCSKNLVDTQHLMGHIFTLAPNNPNYDIIYLTDPYSKENDYVFLNTCGFIKAGRDEMFATIEKLLKKRKTVYLLGCGLQYFQDTNKQSCHVGIIDKAPLYEKELLQGLKDNGCTYTLLSRDKADKIDESQFDFFIFPGTTHAKSIIHHSKSHQKEIAFIKQCKKPIFGICLGHEIIAKTFGSSLYRLPKKRKETRTITLKKNPIFNKSKLHVYENHIYGIKKLGTQLERFSKTKNYYEIIKHKTKPIFGFQFHPEKSRAKSIFSEVLTHFKKLSNQNNTEEKNREKISESKNLHSISWVDFENISIQKLIKGYDSKDFSIPSTQFPSPRAYTNAEYGFEYLKIAEGCNNKCTFCIIPRIRGGQKSVAPQKIVNEIKNMIKTGIQEVILIAQDSSQYGTDLKNKNLISLLEKIDKIKGDFKYRLLYLYPDLGMREKSYVSLLRKLKKLKKFIPYFDIPFQHVSKPILKRMGRELKENVEAYVSNIRKIFPNSYIRTNFIIGFPGETEKDHKQLLTLIKKGYFDNVALFEYHDEPLATSNKLNKKVSNNTIRKRFTQARQLVNIQLLEKEEGRKGKTFTGYIMDIDRTGQELVLLVRPDLHAPDIDPYDEIILKKITGIYNASNTVNIGDKIDYIL